MIITLPIINNLKSLLELLEEHRAAVQFVENAEQDWKDAKFHFPSELKAFDAEHLEKYVQNNLGEKPQPESGFWKKGVDSVKGLLNRKSSYKQQLKLYEEKRPFVEKAYYAEYAEERNRIRESDEKKHNEAIQVAEEAFVKAKAEVNQYQKQINANTIVADKFKNIETVSLLIQYLEEQRADSLKEAINLWYDEMRKESEAKKEDEHRAAMEEYARRQCEAAEDIAESARQAAQSAEEASEEARKAREAAEDAKNAAEEARNAANY